MDEFVMKLLSGKLIQIIADFNVIYRHKMHKFLNVLNVEREM